MHMGNHSAGRREQAGRLRLFMALLVIISLISGSALAETWYPPIYSDIGTSSVGANTTSAQKYSSHWEYWSQGASGYSQMRSYGCRITAQAKLLVEAGIAPAATATFNPDVFYNWTVSKGYQGSGVYENAPLGQAVIGYANEKGRVASLTKVNLSGGNNASNNTIVMNYLRDGYYCYLYSGSHCAYVLRSFSLSKGTAVVSDSFSDTTIYPGNQWFSQLRGYNGYGTGGYGGVTYTQLYAYKFVEEGKLDVNGYLDGVNKGSLESYGIFDVYIGGKLAAQDVRDYCVTHSKGTGYEVKNIRPNDGYEYLGVKNGSLSGTVGSGGTIDVRLSFATQGSLVVQGELDGVADATTDNYGTFDVYTAGRKVAAGVTSFSGRYGTGTEYEIRNITPLTGKNYTGLEVIRGTVRSNTESRVALAFTTNGTATPDWQVAKAVPGNLDRETIDIEYLYTYTEKARDNPGEGWELVETGPLQYENDGAQYESDNELPTSAERVLVGYYYFHWCNNGANANYYEKSYLPVRHKIGMENVPNFSVEEKGTDGDGSGRKFYFLKHLNGTYAGGYAMCSSTGSQVYYRGYVYQNRKSYRINTYQKQGDWTSVYDAQAERKYVRWRLKEGIATEYKGLQLNFVVDGEPVQTLEGTARLDVVINGEMKANHAVTFRAFYPGEFSYQIQISELAEDKLYQKIEGGELNGTVTEDLKEVTLYFVTGVEAGEDWKTISERVLPYVGENAEIEYRHTYTEKARTSPGEDWVLVQEGAVQYENDGAQYESDNELTTSATRVLVGYYYFHWCDNGASYNANYYQKSYLPTYHKVPMSDVNKFTVTEQGTDGDGSGRKYYKLVWKSGQWAGGTASCTSNGTQVYYRGAVYQNKKAYRINTYEKTGEWTTEPDTSASSVEYRIRLKQYPVVFDANDGSFGTESLTKYSGIGLVLPEEVPVRALYDFREWNTKADGTGMSYFPGAVYEADEALLLYACWKPLAMLDLPAGVQSVEEEAFVASPAVVIRIPDSCTEIGARAFADCPNLQMLNVTAATTSIALDAFENCPNLTIYAPAGSTAIKVAKYNDIPYVEE